MNKIKNAVPLIVLGALMVSVSPAWAIWMPDGVPICTAAGEQFGSQLIADSVGGVIITWQDQRSGFSWDIYALRDNAAGVRQWDVDGLEICTAAGDQRYPQLATDGADGAIIAWEDSRSGISANHDIYAQRVHAGGWVEWAAPGVALCAAAGNQQYPYIISDGAGGAIATWMDARNGNYDVYAQRVDAAGVVQWTTNGVAVCATSVPQTFPKIVTDGAGGAIIAWTDEGSAEYRYFVAQRVSASGTLLWPASGVLLTTFNSYKHEMDLDADGTGGAVVSWLERRGSYDDIYAQRIDSSGAVQWTATGAPVCTAGAEQAGAEIVSDGQGGALIAWSDDRSGVGTDDIFAQKLTPAGVVQWTWAPTGRLITSLPGRQTGPQLASDRLGGAVITWSNDEAAGQDIYAQWVDHDGTNRWEVDGMPLCTATGVQTLPTITFGSQGYAIVAWNDGRSGLGPFDIYAEETELTCSGVETPESPASVHLSQNYPNPFNPATSIAFTLEATAQVSLRIYDAAGRFVRALVEGVRPAAAFTEIWDGRDASGNAVAGGVYYCRLKAGDLQETRKMTLVR